MRKLERDSQAPDCLAKFKHGRDHWASVNPQHKTEIWQKLTIMQRGRCAYCERTLSDDFRHIEHFRQRDQFPQKTFDWANLFGSCNNEATCGKHKDAQWCATDDHTNLIKPDVDDPADFLLFADNGTISPRPGLVPAEMLRAEETLRIFNLDADGGPLRRMRADRIIGPKQQFDDLISMLLDMPDAANDIVAEMQAEIDNAKDQEFSTAIVCVLKELVSGLAIAPKLHF